MIRYRFSYPLLLIGLCLSLTSLGAWGQGNLSSTSATKRVTWRPTIPRPTSPANLVIENIKFNDANGDGRIGANETFSLDFAIRNQGSGAAYIVKPEVKCELSSSYIVFAEQQPIKTIFAGESQLVRVAGKSSQSLPDGRLGITISSAEGNGFIPTPHTLYVDCYGFKPPRVVVGQYLFSSEDGGVPRPEQVITLKMIVQNEGQSNAENVRVDFSLPKNVYQGAQTSIVIPKLEPGEQRLIEFPFFTNKSFDGQSVTIDTKLSESYGKYAAQMSKMPSVNLSKSLDKANSTTIAAVPQEVKPEIKMGTLSLISDVNENIPVTNRSQPNVFALVVGNENYQNTRDIDVPFANSDASTFAEYMSKTIGLPSTNITLVHDGTAAKLQAEIERIAKLAKSYTDRGEEKAEIILYWAGHGLTSNTRDGYLLPVDVTAANITRGIRTADMYQILAASGAKKVTVFIDACFSGETRGSSLLEGRGVIVEPNADNVSGNLVIFTATSKDQIAYAYNDKLHGMFTYYLLAKLKESQGKVNFKELSDYLKKEVTYHSILIHYTEQTPNTITSPDIADQWQNWCLTAQ